MKAVFVKLPAFERHRADYLGDEAFRDLQDALMKNPEAGEVIEGTAGYARCDLPTSNALRASALAYG